MYAESKLLPLSALQHLAYCERQCALIHIEQVWADNSRTAEGEVLHEKAHSGEGETRGVVRIARGLKVRSLRLGLSGQTDVVEFREGGNPYPVEYKRGKPKDEDWDEVQLCAQAMCLEELLDKLVLRGALFYNEVRRRVEVEFTPALRARVEELSGRLHQLIGEGRTPAPFAKGTPESKRCRRCSLNDLCIPGTAWDRGRASRYVRREVSAVLKETDPA